MSLRQENHSLQENLSLRGNIKIIKSLLQLFREAIFAKIHLIINPWKIISRKKEQRLSNKIFMIRQRQSINTKCQIKDKLTPSRVLIKEQYKSHPFQNPPQIEILTFKSDKASQKGKLRHWRIIFKEEAEGITQTLQIFRIYLSFRHSTRSRW